MSKSNDQWAKIDDEIIDGLIRGELHKDIAKRMELPLRTVVRRAWIYNVENLEAQPGVVVRNGR